MAGIFSSYHGQSSFLPAGSAEVSTLPGKYINQALDQVGQSIATAEEDHKREQLLGKGADAVWASIPEEQRPMDSTAYKNMSARDRAAYVEGIIKGQAYKKGQQDLLEHFTNIEATKARTAYEDALRKRLEDTTAREDDADQRWKAFDQHILDRVTMPPGQVGPIPALTPQEVMQMLMQHGLTRDKHTDDFLNSLEKLNPPPKASLGTPGMVIDVPGMPGTKFGWMTPTTGQFLQSKDKPDPTEMDTPEGYVRDQASGKLYPDRSNTEKTNARDDNQLQAIASYNQILAQLGKLKAAGYTRAVVDPNSNAVTGAGGWNYLGADNIDDLIAKHAAERDNLQTRIGATKPKSLEKATKNQPAPSAGDPFQDYLKWRQGQ